MQTAAETPPIESLGVKLPEWTPETVTRVWETIDAYPFLGSLVIVASPTWRRRWPKRSSTADSGGSPPRPRPISTTR